MLTRASIDHRSSTSCVRDVKLSQSTLKDASKAEIASDYPDTIVDAEDQVTGTCRGVYADSIVSSSGSCENSEEGDAIDMSQFSLVELQEQLGQRFVEGMNPYVEQLRRGEELDLEDDLMDSEIEMSGSTRDEDLELTEWENPSYVVKDLDTGESYRVEEIDQQFTLVTLDSVAAQHARKYGHMLF